jgi:hypothetical protein
MKLKALVQKPENIVRFLKHLGEPTEPPPLAPARAPPYWQARELRHRPQPQTELFDAWAAAQAAQAGLKSASGR